MQVAVVTDLACARGAISLKAAATLYEKIVIIRTREGTLDRQCRKHLVEGLSSSEIDWLLKNDVIQLLDEFAVLSAAYSDEDIGNISGFRSARYAEFLLLSPSQYEKMAMAVASFVSRYLVARDLLKTDDGGADFIPLTFNSNYKLEIDKFFPGEKLSPSGKGEIGTAIIRNYIKIPEEATPWEAILDFRSDTENRMSLINLRRFIKHLATADLTPSEIRDELDQDIHYTNKTINNSKLKFKDALVEASVVGTAHVIENLLKLNFGELAQNIFSVKKAHTELLQSEENFSARNTYYLLKVNETLGSNIQ
ncbi:hypothetical protein E0H62_33740 [Rhizobium leguminosarum bv. viciae]|nr:hypothetical protein E0H62_33740 [Rhizobium leguminosarum bv. viciae]